MVDVVFVRHAPTSWSGRRYCGRGDPPLSVAGREAAATLAAALAPGLARDVLIVSSPARRARQTAAPIAAAAGVRDLEIDERWRETDFGIAEGRTFDELSALAPDLAKALLRGASDIDWPGGETAAVLEARVEAAWRAIMARGLPVVVVSHAGPLRHALALARAVAPADIGLIDPATAVRVSIPVRRPVPHP